jgi:hypothetical protein
LLDWYQQLEVLPESFGQLKALTALHLNRCCQLLSLPASIGGLIELGVFDVGFMQCAGGTGLSRCHGSSTQLCYFVGKQLLTSKASSTQPLRDQWSPQKQIAHVLALQRSQPAISKLATQEETMLTT